MKLTCTAAMLAGFLLSGCTSSLEQIVDTHHQSRIDAANANRPLAGGAADGLGRFIAQRRDEASETANP